MTQPSPNDVNAQADWQVTALGQLNDVLDAIMQAKPDRADPMFTDPSTHKFDSVTYSKALSDWGQSYGKVQAQVKNLQLSSAGLVQLPDGTMMATGKLTPEQQAQLDHANKNAYTDILNKFGLSQFNVLGSAADRANQTAQQDFSNKMDTWDRMLGLDKFGFDQAKSKLDRYLKVKEQATSEAGLEQEAQKLAIPYGSPNGQTSFTGQDLGGAVGAMASMAGIDPGAALLRYPGTQTMDPLGTIDKRSAAMGVSGAAPTLDLPNPLATAANMPASPTFQQGPGAPNLQAPMLAMPAPAPGLPDWRPENLPLPNTIGRPSNGRGPVAA